MLRLNKNNSYSKMDTPCIQDVSKMDTEVRLGKDSLDKGRSVKDRLGKESSDNSCGNNTVDFLELLTDEEIGYLKTIYEDVYELMDEAGADATKKRKKVEEPFSYLIGYATNKGWLEK